MYVVYQYKLRFKTVPLNNAPNRWSKTTDVHYPLRLGRYPVLLLAFNFSINKY